MRGGPQALDLQPPGALLQQGAPCWLLAATMAQPRSWLGRQALVNGMRALQPFMSWWTANRTVGVE